MIMKTCRTQSSNRIHFSAISSEITQNVIKLSDNFIAFIFFWGKSNSAVRQKYRTRNH